MSGWLLVKFLTLRLFESAADADTDQSGRHIKRDAAAECRYTVARLSAGRVLQPGLIKAHPRHQSLVVAGHSTWPADHPAGLVFVDVELAGCVY